MSAGLKAARALLGLIEENSAEDFEAAESVLGAEQDLVHILDLLRRYKEQQEEPFGLAQLREIVRREVLGLDFKAPELLAFLNASLPNPIRGPISGLTKAQMMAIALDQVETEAASPAGEVKTLLDMLFNAMHLSGQGAKLLPLLRSLAIRSLVENVAMFPSLHALANLRTHWAGAEPLPFEPHESRRKLVTRLCADAEQRAPKDALFHIMFLIQQGMRGPGDGAITAMRRMKPKKAHGSGQG